MDHEVCQSHRQEGKYVTHDSDYSDGNKKKQKNPETEAAKIGQALEPLILSHL